MNERIRQLWEQAGEEIEAEYEDESRRNRRLYNEIFLPKFAELIVRECLEACSRANEIKHFVPPTQEQVVLSCMREIETTFRS